MQNSLDPRTVEALQQMVGSKRRLWPLNSCASREAIRRFALGIGDDNPLWWNGPVDSECAYAPPTFLYSVVNFGTWPDVPFTPTDTEPLLTFWVGDRWRWNDRILVDEALAAESQLDNIRRRQSASGAVSVLRTERVVFTGNGGRRLAELLRRTISFSKSGSAPADSGEQTPRPYSPSELEAIYQCYDEEEGRRQGESPRWWHTVAAGDRIGPIVKGPITVSNLVGWTMGVGSPMFPTNRMLVKWLRDYPTSRAINAETRVPDAADSLHWDLAIASEFGLLNGFAFGAQRISWVAHLLTDWCGDEGFIEELDVRLLKLNFLGDVNWLDGRVIDTALDREGRGLVHCEITGCNRAGTVTTLATATIQLPVEH